MGKFIDLTGKRYSRLTVIEKTDQRANGSVVWRCQCDCGNECFVSSRRLNAGTKSCGCLQKEITSNRMRKDLTGQRFGKLIALEPTNERKHGSIVWKCLCDCGNICYTYTEMLMNGHTQSCGCTRSRGNAKIKNILQENNYLYIAEYPIRINKTNYYFDFAILSDQKAFPVAFIEYDGILHFNQDDSHGWNNKENWLRTQENDKIKNQWCEENNIPLIRIPYTDFDQIDINYIKRRLSDYGLLCPSD